jgi:hypothetical protein
MLKFIINKRERIMKLILALLLTTSTSFAHDYKVVCEARGHSGDSVSRAIEACAQYSSSRRESCARNISCTTYRTHCEANRFAGDTVSKAIEACTQYSTRSRKQCSTSVTCK